MLRGVSVIRLSAVDVEVAVRLPLLHAAALHFEFPQAGVYLPAAFVADLRLGLERELLGAGRTPRMPERVVPPGRVDVKIGRLPVPRYPEALPAPLRSGGGVPGQPDFPAGLPDGRDDLLHFVPERLRLLDPENVDALRGHERLRVAVEAREPHVRARHAMVDLVALDVELLREPIGPDIALDGLLHALDDGRLELARGRDPDRGGLIVREVAAHAEDGDLRERVRFGRATAAGDRFVGSGS